MPKSEKEVHEIYLCGGPYCAVIDDCIGFGDSPEEAYETALEAMEEDGVDD